MALKKITHGTKELPFYAGMSDSEKGGIAGSADLVQQLNIHEDPSYITLHPATSKISASTVTNLPKWIVSGAPFDTNKYAYDAAGNIYKIDSGNVVTLDRAGSTIGNGAAGQGMLVFDDWLYYATSTTLGRKGLLDGTPAYSDDFLTDGTVNLDQSDKTSYAQTYTLPAAISEAATAKHNVIPTRDPIKEIDVLLTAKGTGNWTLTVHDSYNNVIGSATVANASLVAATNYQPFTFSTPLRVVNNNTYHYHLTSTTGDGTVQSSALNDLSTSNYKEFFGILIADTDFHPMEELNGLIIGNNNYLAKWDETTYNPNAVVLDKGYKVRSIFRQNEFVVALAWKGPNIDSVEEGKAYLWDGIQSVFNDSYPISAGLPNAGINFKNRPFTFLGSSGEMYMGVEPFQKIQTLQTLLARGKKMEVAPGAITTWQGRLLAGLGYNTDDASMLQGVYGFGNSSDKYPEVFTYDFLISTGDNQATNIKIGAVKGIGKDLYIGWQDATSYGIDKVTKTDNAAASGSWNSLIFDDGDSQKQKLALILVIKFAALTTGQSVTPKYLLDRAASFTLGTAVTSGSRAELPINARFNEMQYGFNVASSSGTFPKITAVYLEYDDLSEEVYKS